ncbi:MAG TPA: peptidylprolyl isomerase [Armatimonadota bacterium]|jgi:hypothetical protein
MSFSLMGMRRTMASKQTATIILWALIAVFVVSAVVMVPGMFGGKNQSKSSRSTQPGANVVIASVNGTKITAGELDDEFYAKQEPGTSSYDVNSALGARNGAFDRIVQRLITDQAAKEMHVSLHSWTLRSLAKDLAQSQVAQMHEMAQQKAKTMADAAKTKEAIKQLQTADQIFAEQMKGFMQQMGAPANAKIDDETFTRAFVDYVLRKGEGGFYDRFAEMARMRQIGAGVIKTVPVSPYTDAYVQRWMTKEVKASWIFIAASAKTAKGMQEAQDTAKKLRESIIKTPASFATVARASSKDMMSGMNGGSLDWIKGGGSEMSMTSPMAEYLAFAYPKGEISPVVQIALPNPFTGASQVGYAFLRVEDERDRADRKGYDYAKGKDLALLRTKDRFDAAFADNYLSSQRAMATIERKSPELQYYGAQETNDRATMLKLQGQLKDEALLPPVVTAAFKYQVYQVEKDPKTKVKLLESVVPFAGGETAKMQLELGRLYAQVGQKDMALLQFGYLADGAETSDPDQSLHNGLKAEYTKLGDAKGIQRMTEWLKTHPKQPQPAGGMSGMPMGMPSGSPR